MKAMIFAAGAGTRLKPYTDNAPKALFEIEGYPLLQLVIDKLRTYGVSDLIINIHHFPEQIRHFLSSASFCDLNIKISDESNHLLDTGGGLLKAMPLFAGADPVLIHNTDVLSDLPFSLLSSFHEQQGAMASLAVNQRSSSRQLIAGPDFRLRGWIHREKNSLIRCLPPVEHEQFYAYSGIGMIHPSLPSHFKSKGSFGLIPALLEIGAEQPVFLFHQPHRWADIGKADAPELGKQHFHEYYKNYLT